MPGRIRFEDEQFVKVYKADAPEWLILPWEAQALYLLVYRKVDRAGLIELGGLGIDALATIVGPSAWAVLEVGVRTLFKYGWFVLNGTTLCLPDYLPAQAATQNSRARKRAERIRKRDLARAVALGFSPPPEEPEEEDDDEALGEDGEGDVTKRDTASRGAGGAVTNAPANVTPRRDETRRDETDQKTNTHTPRARARVDDRDAEIPAWCIGQMALDRIWRRVSGDLVPAGGFVGMDRLRQSIEDLARDGDALAAIQDARPDLDLSTGEAVAEAVLKAFKRLIDARKSVKAGLYAPPFTALSLVNDNWSNVQAILRGQKNPEAEAEAERVEMSNKRRAGGGGGRTTAAPSAATQTTTTASSKWGVGSR